MHESLASCIGELWAQWGPQELARVAVIERAAAKGCGLLERERREAQEEAAVVIDGDALVTFSHWLPPPVAPKRFSTWFFLARAPDAIEVAVDNREIRDHEWLRPVEAINRRDAGEIELAPPTWVTLWRLSGVDTVDQAVRLARESEPQRFETHMYFPDGVPVAVWHDDVAYDSGDLHHDGPRHRLWMLPDGWRYEATT